jgi:hypothetical protein
MREIKGWENRDGREWSERRREEGRGGEGRERRIERVSFLRLQFSHNWRPWLGCIV